MEKEKLLRILEREELKRIGDMTSSQFFHEYCEWFMLEDAEVGKEKKRTNTQRLNDYMDDFMAWKGQYSVDELKETIKMSYGVDIIILKKKK